MYDETYTMFSDESENAVKPNLNSKNYNKMIIISIILFILVLTIGISILLLPKNKTIEIIKKNMINNAKTHLSITPISSVYPVKSEHPQNNTVDDMDKNSSDINSTVSDAHISTDQNNEFLSANPVNRSISETKLPTLYPDINQQTSNNVGQNQNNSDNDSDTSDWNQMVNYDYGYSLRYPNNWIAEQTIYSGSTQSTNFHTISNPSEVIAIFYIRPVPIADLNSIKTKYHLTDNSTLYSYQCVPVSNFEIITTCTNIENTIIFTN